MSTIQVFREKEENGSWVFWCSEHNVETTAEAWDLAYEAALGHAAFSHQPPRRTLRELIYTFCEQDREEVMRHAIGWHC